MQIFERYNISEGACQFAYAALEQVDDAYNFIEMTEEFDPTKAATYTRGRLWANVFKFTLDLNLLNDAYCAIISNPDEEIKRICLRRFIIVLFECGKTKVEVKNPFLLLSKFFLLCFWRRGTKTLKVFYFILSGGKTFHRSLSPISFINRIIRVQSLFVLGVSLSEAINDFAILDAVLNAQDKEFVLP